ncbi:MULTISPECIES: NADH-quinone oxidoreductase subunit C [Collinsella]|uniref:NADH-quinone oxidoreductase subunit C n=1 Tax=Collinsella TaxID=102106 RepID=UPI000E53B0BE|nr:MULTISPECIES: NADH-quinone oxidoreductase subunit C [Collinsella]MBS6555502.1 NADH-quinone oxidoreductase subunit C [Collinsella stercoris]MEE0704403.1 NADH-quinone oxidoreductase subunit C [Collinsella sp.]RHS41570.1 NADH-quinone oxidoreductase subunit C [Collinsella sp. AF08-23]
MYTTSFVDLPLEELLTRVQTLKHEGIRFVQMCAETTERGIDLLYTFYDETTQNALNLCVYGIDESSRVPSIQGLYFAAFSYENEAHDLYGVRFVNMKLDFGGHFFNLATSEPMTIITPEMKAEREKLAKKKAAAAAKAEAAAKKAREAAEAAQAERALGTSAAEADSAAVAAVNAAAPAPTPAPAAKPAMTAEERAAKMEAKLANMDPEKAAKIRAALAAKAAKDAAAGKDGE